GRRDGRRGLGAGARRGCGGAIALAFAREGARVAVNYLASQRQADEAVAEAKGLGAEAFAIRGDVASEPEARAMIGAAVDRFGGLDILVNNAGIMVRGPLLQVDADAYRRMPDINLTGTIQCTPLAPPALSQPN